MTVMAIDEIISAVLEQLLGENVALDHTYEEALNLPTSNLLALTKNEKESLVDHGFFRLKDFNFLWLNVVPTAKLVGIPEKKLLDIAAAVRLLVLLKEKGFYIDYSNGYKLLVLGVEDSGKTAIINYLWRYISTQAMERELERIQPTHRVKTHDLTIGGAPLVLLEVPGGEDFRKRFLSQPKRFLWDIDMILFVVDVSSRSHDEENVRLFADLAKVLAYLHLQIPIKVFLNKADPGQDVTKNVQWYQNRLGSVAEIVGALKQPTFVVTSLKNVTTLQQAFHEVLNDIVPVGRWLEGPLSRLTQANEIDVAAVFAYPSMVLLGYHSPDPQSILPTWLEVISKSLEDEPPLEDVKTYFKVTEAMHHEERYFVLIQGFLVEDEEFLFAAIFDSGIDAFAYTREEKTLEVKKVLAPLLELLRVIHPEIDLS